jgi:MFS family permease
MDGQPLNRAEMDELKLESATMRRISTRVLPLLFGLYLFCYIDRSNVGMAALQMNADLGFSAATFGFGAGILFLGYSLFEVPSNLILVRVGARRWFARIAISWGLIACAMMWVRTPGQFYTGRFLLGVAEAGFPPGVFFFLSRWYPDTHRARALALFLLGNPLAQAIGAPLGGLLLGLRGVGHLAGWQWLFLIEGLPSILLGIALLLFLTESPADARWLSGTQRDWLGARLAAEQRRKPRARVRGPASLSATFSHPLVWLLAAIYFAEYTVALAYTLWAPTLLRASLGTSNAATGFVTGAIALLGALVFVLAARWSDRHDERCGVAAFGFALACAGCLEIVLFPHSPLRLVGLAAMAMLTPIVLASFWVLPGKFLEGTSAAAGIGLISAVGSSGGFIGPTLVGFLKQSTGSDTGAFTGLAAIALFGAVALLWIRQSSSSLRPRVKLAAAEQ